jgi:DNA-binding MarR family transcriptional regulator
LKYIEIIVKLRKIIRSINLESKKVEKELGISIPQLLVLKYLSDQIDYRAFAKDIKGYINLNASTVSGILRRLESKGLVAKKTKPNDKRATYIILTAKGADVLHKSPPTLQEKLSQRLKTLSHAQIEELDRNIELLTLILNVEDMDAAPLLTIDEIADSPE